MSEPSDFTKASISRPPKLPDVAVNVPTDAPPWIRQFVGAVKEVLQTREGLRGDVLDAGVTFRDLSNAGLLADKPGAENRGGPPPKRPLVPEVKTPTAVIAARVPDLTPPPTPEALELSAGLSHVMATIGVARYPQGGGHAFTRIRAAKRAPGEPAPVLGDAVAVAVFDGTVGSWGADPGSTFHVWAEWVSRDGVASLVPFGGANGVVVQTAQDASVLIPLLAGAISSSELAQELAEPIARIGAPGGIEDQIASLTQAVGSAEGAAESAQEANTAKVAAETARAAAQTAATNAASSATAADGSAKSAAATLTTVQATAGQVTTDKGAAMAAAQSAISTANLATATANEAKGLASSTATSVTTLEALAKGRKGTALNADPGCAVPSAWVNGGHGDTAQFVEVSDGRVGNRALRGTTGQSADSAEWIEVDTTRTYRLSAWVRSSSDATGTFWLRYLSADGAQQFPGIEAYIPPRNGVWQKVEAAFTPISSRIKVRVILNWLNGPGFMDVQDIRLTDDADFASLRAAVQTEASVRASETGQLMARQGVQLDVNGYVTGYQQNNDGKSGSFIIRTDRFAIGSPGQGSKYPFVVVASPTTINGVAVPAGCYMDAATILDGSITTAKIGLAQIDNARIANLDATKITTGFLSADRIQAYSIKAEKIDTKGLVLRDDSGNAFFSAYQPLDASRITPSDNWINNLIDLSWWQRGGSMPWGANDDGGVQQGLFTCSASGSADLPIATYGPIPGPRSETDVVLYARENSSNGNNGGGWNNGTFVRPLDPSKTYRFVLPVRRLWMDRGGSAWWGGYNLCDLNTTNVSGNPYFCAGKNLPQKDRWYLLVGYVYPYGSTGNTSESAGVWDCKTGQKIDSGANWNHGPGGMSVHRAYQFYAGLGAEQLFGRPQCHLVTGSEPPLREYFEGGAVLNTALSINPDGTLVNGGSAQGRVTLPGMGLRSFRVATWGLSAATTPGNLPSGPGLYRDGQIIAGVGRSWVAQVLRRSDGELLRGSSWDVYGDPAQAGALAAFLNACTPAEVVVVYSWDEPRNNRLENGLLAAMLRCGASRAIFESTAFRVRSAYCLIGYGGCGEGNGNETYVGDVDASPTAWLDVSFGLQGGNIVGLGAGSTVTPTLGTNVRAQMYGGNVLTQITPYGLLVRTTANKTLLNAAEGIPAFVTAPTITNNSVGGVPLLTDIDGNNTRTLRNVASQRGLAVSLDGDLMLLNTKAANLESTSLSADFSVGSTWADVPGFYVPVLAGANVVRGTFRVQVPSTSASLALILNCSSAASITARFETLVSNGGNSVIQVFAEGGAGIEGGGTFGSIWHALPSNLGAFSAVSWAVITLEGVVNAQANGVLKLRAVSPTGQFIRFGLGSSLFMDRPYTLTVPQPLAAVGPPAGLSLNAYLGSTKAAVTTRVALTFRPDGTWLLTRSGYASQTGNWVNYPGPNVGAQFQFYTDWDMDSTNFETTLNDGGFDVNMGVAITMSATLSVYQDSASWWCCFMPNIKHIPSGTYLNFYVNGTLSADSLYDDGAGGVLP